MNNNLKYRTSLFWEINEANIEEILISSDEWVVPRVFEYGTITDIDDVLDLYGRDKVKAILSNTKLRPMGRAMAYLFLGVDSENRYAV